MMEDMPDANSGEDHIEHNDPDPADKILACWAQGMTIGQTAQATGIAVTIVRSVLKKKQKEFVEQSGGGYG